MCLRAALHSSFRFFSILLYLVIFVYRSFSWYIKRHNLRKISNSRSCRSNIFCQPSMYIWTRKKTFLLFSIRFIFDFSSAIFLLFSTHFFSDFFFVCLFKSADVLKFFWNCSEILTWYMEDINSFYYISWVNSYMVMSKQIHRISGC